MESNQTEHWKSIVISLKDLAKNRYGNNFIVKISQESELPELKVKEFFSFQTIPNLKLVLSIADLLDAGLVFSKDQTTKRLSDRQPTSDELKKAMYRKSSKSIGRILSQDD